MQKLFISLFLGTALILGGLKVEAQHNYVRTHPTAHVVERGKAPSAKHVWVAAEWNYSGGQYVEVPAHWDLPPQGHHAWIAGHWAKESRGSYWVPGHWR